MRSMSLVDGDIFASSSRAEWPAVLHNVCVLHNVIRLRSQYHTVGWNEPNVINPGALELSVSVFIATRACLIPSMSKSSHCYSSMSNSLTYMIVSFNIVFFNFFFNCRCN